MNIFGALKYMSFNIHSKLYLQNSSMDFEVTGLLPGSTYTIAVRAKNKFGTSKYHGDYNDDDNDVKAEKGNSQIVGKSTKTKFVWICEP